MTDIRISRRHLIAGAGALAAAALPAAAADPKPPAEPFRYMLNTSTIREQKLSLEEKIALAAKAGFHAVEPWIRELEQYVKDGGNLKDLGKRIRDVGLTVESAIGFAEWIVDDDARRKKGLETAKRDMDLVQQIGGKRIAAPPAGRGRPAWTCSRPPRVIAPWPRSATRSASYRWSSSGDRRRR